MEALFSKQKKQVKTLMPLRESSFLSLYCKEIRHIFIATVGILYT